MKLDSIISGISCAALIAVVFLPFGYAKAQPSPAGETCTVLVEKVLHRPGDAGFDELAARVENLTAFGPKSLGARDGKPMPASGLEYIHFEFVSETCSAERDEGVVLRKAGDPDCSYIGCQAVFPGNNMPIGSVMTIKSCGSGVETIRSFKRVGTSPDSTGTDGIWQLTNYSTRAVSHCPSYQEP